MPQQALSSPLLEQFLTYRLHSLSKLSDGLTHKAYMDELSLALGEARCLAALGRFEPIVLNEVAKYANLDKSHASRSIQSLVQRGLVYKEPNPQDGRSHHLRCTSDGLRLYQKIITLIARRNQEIFSCLNATEQNMFSTMLDRIIAQQHK